MLRLYVFWSGVFLDERTRQRTPQAVNNRAFFVWISLCSGICCSCFCVELRAMQRRLIPPICAYISTVRLYRGGIYQYGGSNYSLSTSLYKRHFNHP
jgi:hypothetical protein